MLSISLIVPEGKELIAPQWTAQRHAKVVPLERRNLRLVKIVPCIKGAVAKKLIHGAMQIVIAGGRNDRNLSARPLPIVRSISVAYCIEFPHRLHSQQLTARAARRDVDKRSSGVFNAVQQKQVVLRTPPGDRKHVSHRGVR